MVPVDDEARLPFWSEAVPHDELAQLCCAALAGQDPHDAYLSSVAGLAWDGATAAVGGLLPVRAELRLTADAYLEAAALTSAADGGVELSLRFLRGVALESLFVAEELTVEYSAEFAYGAPPAWVIGVDEFVARVITTGDRDGDDVNYVLDDVDHVALLYETIARGDAAPAVGNLRRGLREAGLVAGHLRAGDERLLADADWGGHILRLHHHLLLNTLVFGLVHEFAHLYLRHFDDPVEDLAAARAQELAADDAALDALGPSLLVDIPSALRVFQYLHLQEEGPAGSDLTHPHSTTRLRLLATAVRSGTADPFTLGRVKELLRSLKEPVGEITLYDTRSGVGAPALASAGADWDAAYVTAVADAPGDGLVGIDVAFVLPVSHEVVARARLIRYIPASTGHPVTDGGRERYRIELRVPTPPAWRFGWPDGLLRVERIVGKDGLPLARLLRAGAVAEWDTPASELIGIDVLRAGLHLYGPLWTEVANLSDWLDEYGYHDESVAFRGMLLETYPELATFGLALRTVRQLVESGEPRRAVDLGRAYLGTGMPVRPGLHLQLARAADALGDPVGTYDGAFIEALTSGTFAPEAQALQADAFRRYGDDPAIQALLVFHAAYLRTRPPRLTPFRRRVRLAATRAALAPLCEEPLVSHRVLSIGQQRAEVYHDLWRLGEEWALAPAREHFDGINGDYPWFVGGWVQSAYLYDDLGDRDGALERFRIAESIAPRHVHVEEARQRFFPRAHRAYPDRARAFIDLSKQYYGLDQPKDAAR